MRIRIVPMADATRDRLRTWRVARGLTQREAADRAHMQQAAWSLIESGHRLPTLAQAVEIKRLTGIRESAWPRTSRSNRVRADGG